MQTVHFREEYAKLKSKANRTGGSFARTKFELRIQVELVRILKYMLEQKNMEMEDYAEHYNRSQDKLRPLN